MTQGVGVCRAQLQSMGEVRETVQMTDSRWQTLRRVSR
jgi:hypothetical protein